MVKKSELEQIILQFEKKLLKQEIRKPAEILADILVDDFIEIGSSGKFYTKNDVLKELPDQQFAKIKISEF